MYVLLSILDITVLIHQPERLRLQGFFKASEFYTLQLLDIIGISTVIGDVMKSLVTVSSGLGLILYLYFVTCMVYTSVAMKYFRTALQVRFFFCKIVSFVTIDSIFCKQMN